MTVAELIEKLREMPQDAEVSLWDSSIPDVALVRDKYGRAVVVLA